MLRALALVFVFTVIVSAGQVVDACTLLALTDTGEMFASSDNGETWDVVGVVPVSDAVAIAAADSSELFLTSRSGVIHRSIDAGLSWVAVGTVPVSDVVDMVIRNNGDWVLLSATGTLWRSQDDGATFSAIATLTASNHVSLTGDASGVNLYALTQTGEVARSTDFGVTWNTVGTIATSEAVDIRAIGQTLYVLTGAGYVAKSTDSGVTWTMVGTVSQVHMSGLTRYLTGLVAVTKEGLVATSSDGTSWSFVGSISQLNVVAIGNDDFGCQTVPATLQGLESYWTGHHVKVTWRLIGIEGELSFDVARATETAPFAILRDVIVTETNGQFTFIDNSVEMGRTYTYRVVVREDGVAVTSFETKITTPWARLALEQNYPNPFNPTTQIPFVIDEAQHVSLGIYDISGRLVQTLVDKPMRPGRHSEEWDGGGVNGNVVASGVYFYRLQAGRSTLTRKAVFLK